MAFSGILSYFTDLLDVVETGVSDVAAFSQKMENVALSVFGAGNPIGSALAQINSDIQAACKALEVLPTAGVGVNGLLVAGLSRAEAGRLRYFEGDDYRLARRSTILTDGTACPAHVFLAASSLHPSQTDWDLGAWRLRAKRRFLASAKRRMAKVKFA